MKQTLKIILGTTVATQLVLGAVISPPSQATITAAGNSFSPTFSADGHHLVFVSHANNLVTNDNLNVWLDVFVRNLVTSNTVLVSVGTSGTGGANADSDYPTISSNGQFVAFASYATDLVPGVANAKKQIFLRDLVNQTTTLVSTGRVGGAADSGADFPQISQNGNWVAFESRSSNLSIADLNLNSLDVYARELQNGTNVLVSINSSGSGANDSQGEKSYWPVITPTGRHVAFLSTALNLLTGSPMPSSSLGDVYLRDLISKTTAWVSVNVPALFSGNPYRCSAPVISDAGRYVAFIATKESGGSSVLRHDLQTSATLTISSTATNTPHGIQMSSDGRFVLFEEMDGNFSRVRLWDAQLSNSAFISCGGDDSRGNAAMNTAATDVTFIGCSNIYVVGSNTLGISVRASVSTNGGASVGDYQFVTPVISPDGTRVAFAATANDLVASDLNAASDIFLRDVNAGVTELITKALPAKPATTAFAHSFLNLNSISADGRFVVSTRYDDLSVYRDTNGWADVFVSDVLNGTSVAVSIISNAYVTNFDGGAGPTVTFIENTNAFETPIISADGSTIYAVRRSPNGRTRIFHAFTTNAASRAGMSLASRGINVSENGNSSSPSTSSNGLLLVFTSTSSDLDPGVPDNNSLPDIYLRRMSVLTNGLLAGTNELVSISRFGNAGNNWSSNAFLSPDGRWVIFESRATDLVTNNTAGLLSLFARDLWSNATHLVSISPTGNDQWGYRFGSSATISGNSRYVAFSSDNIYLTVHDLFTHTSVVAENPTAVSPSLSLDGRVVAFVKQTFGSPLHQIRVRDLPASQSDLISASPAGAPGNGASGSPVVSAEGRYVVFQSQASDLVRNDTNGMSDIFVRDRLLGVTMLVSANAQGGAGNGPSTRPVMAADGRTVVFQGFASDFVMGDYNDKRDLFVLKLSGADTDGDGMDDDWEEVYFDDLSHDGTSDSDGDGVSDLQEFLAGTDPTNVNSFFRVLTVAPAGGGSKLLFWSGNPSRSYRAEFKDDLGAASWTALTGTISWNGSTASITDPGANAATNRYYRIVRLP